jgi:hypothetical protein
MTTPLMAHPTDDIAEVLTSLIQSNRITHHEAQRLFDARSLVFWYGRAGIERATCGECGRDTVLTTRCACEAQEDAA